jgi:hypothetical protein
MATINIDTPSLAPDYPQISVRLVVFQMKKFEQLVMFCFCAEGKICHSREEVRWLIAKPGNKYTYFSKIEAVANYPTDGNSDYPIEVCKTLMKESLQVLIKDYLPLKEQLKHP